MPPEQMNLTTGLHRYFGDVCNLKLRVVVSDLDSLTERPSLSSKATGKTDTLEHSNASDRSQTEAKFLLSRRRNNTGWKIEAESSYSQETYKQEDTTSPQHGNLSNVLQQNGISLRVISAPTSRIGCNSCKRMTALNEDNLAPSDDKNQSICLAACELLENNQQRLLMSYDDEKRTADDKELFQNNPGEICDLIERKRASKWKDTSPMTSDTSNLQQTRARSLVTTATTTLQATKASGILEDGASKKMTKKHINRSLMRNHNWPLCEPCSCSHSVRGGPSGSASINKNTHAKSDCNVSDPKPDCCCPRLTLLLPCIPCRMHVNCNQNRHLDHLKIYTSLTNVSSSHAICYCHCSELSELYKQRQKSSLSCGGALLLGSRLVSLSPERFGFGPNDARPNFTNDDSENNTNAKCKQNARVNSADLDLDDRSETSSGTSRKAQRHYEATKLQKDQNSSIDAAARNSGHASKSGLQRGINDTDNYSRLVDCSPSCRCMCPHGETLFIVMEKYSSPRCKTSNLGTELLLQESENHSTADKDGSRLNPTVSESKIDNAEQVTEAERSKDEICESSVLLATIVVDVLNSRLQLKPDLNQSIIIDMGSSAILGTFSESVTKITEQSTTATSNTPVTAVATVSNCDEIQSARITTKLPPLRLLYSIESVTVEHDSETFEETVSSARDEFGLTQHNRESLTTPSPVPLQGFKLHRRSGLLSSKHESNDCSFDGLTIRLQFDIHFASDFALDCRNLYVKYKLLARWPNKLWKLRRRNEFRVAQQQVKDFSTSIGEQGKLLSQSPRIIRSDLNCDEGSLHERVNNETGDEKALIEERKTEMTKHDKSKWLHIEDPGQFNCSYAATSCFDEKPLEVNKTFTDMKTMVSSNGANGDIVGECLLAGSTITSRPNSRGLFNFSCTEQLVLEMQPRGNRTSEIGKSNCDEIAQSSRSMRTQTHDKSRVLSTEDSDSIASGDSHMVTPDRFRSRQLNKERPIDPPTKTQTEIIAPNLHANTDKQIAFRASSAAKQEQIDVSPSSPSDLFTEVGVSSEKTRDRRLGGGQYDKNLVQEVDEAGGCGSDSKRGEVQYESNFRDSGNDNSVCELILLLEVYSSDFYSDKFQGWASLSIPVSLNQNTGKQRARARCRGNVPHHNGLVTTQPLARESASDSDCTKIRLPVLRPALCGTFDRLRYYLTGKMPNWTPSIESFALSNCRYLLQTQEIGYLTIEHETARRFGAPHPDMATNRSVSNLTSTKARRPHNKFDRLLAKARNSSSSSSSSSDGTLDVETVLDAYKKAKQRMEQLALDSLLATGSNEQSIAH